jgi:hypothetical protein
MSELCVSVNMQHVHIAVALKKCHSVVIELNPNVELVDKGHFQPV